MPGLSTRPYECVILADTTRARPVPILIAGSANKNKTITKITALRGRLKKMAAEPSPIIRLCRRASSAKPPNTSATKFNHNIGYRKRYRCFINHVAGRGHEEKQRERVCKGSGRKISEEAAPGAASIFFSLASVRSKASHRGPCLNSLTVVFFGFVVRLVVVRLVVVVRLAFVMRLGVVRAVLGLADELAGQHPLQAMYGLKQLTGS